MDGLIKSMFQPSVHSVVGRVRQFESRYSGLSATALHHKAAEFRQRLAHGEDVYALVP
jgi:preprotein translocase subunit SecA